MSGPSSMAVGSLWHPTSDSNYGFIVTDFTSVSPLALVWMEEMFTIRHSGALKDAAHRIIGFGLYADRIVTTYTKEMKEVDFEHSNFTHLHLFM